MTYMKSSMETLCPVFCTERMVQEYTERFYLPSFEQWQLLNGEKQSLARNLASWKGKMSRLWSQIRVEGIEADTAEEIAVGTRIRVQARIGVGDIPLEELSVDAYFGVLDPRDEIAGGELAPLLPVEQLGTDLYRFSGELVCRVCGRQGFAVRIMPKHAQIGPVYESELILWA